MKKVGIIGGIGPLSTIDYYMDIIKKCREKLNTADYPLMSIENINMTEMLSYVSNEDWNALVNYLISAINKLHSSGADFALLASNTPHIIFEQLKAKSPLPLISIVEESAKYAKNKNLKKVIILGTLFTMKSQLYKNELKTFGIEAVYPNEKEQEEIQKIIFEHLEDGKIFDEDKKSLVKITNRCKMEHNADSVALACTELPLILQSNNFDIDVLNTTQIHIDAVVNYMI